MLAFHRLPIAPIRRSRAHTPSTLLSQGGGVYIDGRLSIVVTIIASRIYQNTATLVSNRRFVPTFGCPNEAA